MSLTKIVGQFFKPRQYALEKHYTQPEALQEAVLRHLLERGPNTEYGRNHLLSPKNSYE